jgi:hypothetical protein
VEDANGEFRNSSSQNEMRTSAQFLAGPASLRLTTVVRYLARFVQPAEFSLDPDIVFMLRQVELDACV